jgi:hypothetical protein
MGGKEGGVYPIFEATDANNIMLIQANRRAPLVGGAKNRLVRRKKEKKKEKKRKKERRKEERERERVMELETNLKRKKNLAGVRESTSTR